MKTNYKILFPLMAMMMAIGGCKDEKDPCILSVSIEPDPLELYAEPKDGLPPYSYLWQNGNTSSTISASASTYFSVTVTDAVGCTATVSYDTCILSVSIEPDPLEL